MVGESGSHRNESLGFPISCPPPHFFWKSYPSLRASQVALVVKNLLANAGNFRDAGSIPGSGRSPEGGHGNPLQYSCQENPMDRGAWWAMVHSVAKVGHD